MRRQLAAVFAGVAIMITIAFVVPLGILVRDTAIDRALDRARSNSARLVPIVAGGDRQAITSTVTNLAEASKQQITVYLDDAIFGDYVEATDRVNETLTRRASGEGDVRGGKEQLSAVALPQGGVAVIRIVVPSSQLNAGVHRAWLLLGWLALVLIALSVIIAYRIAVRIVRPMERLATAARLLGSGDLSTRVPTDGTAELRDTAVAFNTLAEQIGQSIRRERNTIAELAHRLRTPLTKLRLDVDRATGTGLDDVRTDVDNVSEVVSSFIFEARRAAGSGGCDAALVVNDRAEFWRQLARDENRSMTVDVASDPVRVEVGGSQLGAAIDVLLDNVFTHTPVGTPFRVGLATRDDVCEITVADRGPPLDGTVPAAGTSTVGSTGLGLAIAVRLAAAATGTFDIGRCGNETAAVLCLPIDSHT